MQLSLHPPLLVVTRKNRSRRPVICAASSSTIARRHLVSLSLALVASRILSPATSLASPPALHDLSSSALPAVQAALTKHVTKQKSAVLLRLIFHDCGTFDASSSTGGSNGSIRFDEELSRPENFGLKRGVTVIRSILDDLKGTPAEKEVSFADAVVLAAAASVRVTGGPVIPVQVGRLDTSSPDPTGRLPSENASAESLKRYFSSSLGLSVREMIALCGAHTIGSKGFGDPYIFDNTYYKTLLQKPWKSGKEMDVMIGLPSDHNLPDDAECLPYIEQYAKSQSDFFRDFSTAFIKLASIGVAV